MKCRLMVFLLLSGMPYGVLAQCELTMGSLNLGEYDLLDFSALNGAAPIRVTCANNIVYRIGLGAGITNNGNFTARKMRSSSRFQTLLYNLYTDPNYSQIWGDGTSSTAVINDVGNDRQKTYTVYVKIFANQSVAEGRYTDSVTVTVDW